MCPMFQEFCCIMQDLAKEEDDENGFKEAFREDMFVDEGQYIQTYKTVYVRVFGKDEEGCIHPDEIKFVLSALPSELEGEEIQEMIEIVDRNKDGKISYTGVAASSP